METFSGLTASAIGTFVFYSEYFSTSIYLALYLVPQCQDGIYKDSIAIPIWCPFPLLFTPFFMSTLWIQHKVGVFNLKRSKTLQETPQTTANHLLYRGSKIVYRIRSDADLKFMITFNGIIIFFPVRSITASFRCTVQWDEICKGRTLPRQAQRKKKKSQRNNATAPHGRMEAILSMYHGEAQTPKQPFETKGNPEYRIFWYKKRGRSNLLRKRV